MNSHVADAFQTLFKRLTAGLVLLAPLLLVACGGGGSGGGVSGGGASPNKDMAPTAVAAYSAEADASTAKALQASSLRNLTIASFDPSSAQWLVRAVIDDRFFDNQNGRGVALNSVARFAAICAAGPAPCRFDTYAVAQLPDGTVVESITAYGRYWNFDVAGNGWDGNGSDLKTVARFASGPCLQAVQNNLPCKFETRSFGRLGKDSPIWVESITADGKGFNFDENNTPIGGNGFDLKSIARFAQGPCANVPAGIPCQFTARTFHPVLTGVVDGASWLEWIVRDGFIWVFDLNGQPRDPNSYQRTAATAGAPANQVGILKNIFDYSGYTLIVPGQSVATFRCDVTGGYGNPPPSGVSAVQTIVFNDTGGYSVSSAAENSIGNYQFNVLSGDIKFVNGFWQSASNERNGYLDFRDNNKLFLFSIFRTGSLPEQVKGARCNRIANEPPPPPPTGTGPNPLIPDGAASASFRCTIDVRLPLGGGIVSVVKTPAGGTQLNRDGTYTYTSGDRGTIPGEYAIRAGQQIEFLSGFWSIPAGNGRFGSFTADGNQFQAVWTPPPGSAIQGVELATCVRNGSKNDVDAGPPKATIALADEAKACLNYQDANQCEASKLFVSILGNEGEPRSVTYWAGVPLATVEKRRMFVDTYQASINQFVTGLYKGCLLREPESAAYVDNWRNYIEGNSVVAAARLFASSAEAVAKGSPCMVVVGP